MGQNLQHEDILNQEMQSIFSGIRDIEIEPSPYMKTRVLAQLREQQSLQRKLGIWKLAAFSSLASFAVVVALFFVLRPGSEAEMQAQVSEAYVIHLQFSDQDLKMVNNAEIVLPEGVHFVSKRANLEGQRSLRLPLAKLAAGRNKLPFVVRSDELGSKELKVRLYDEQDHVIQEKVLSVRFAGKNNSEVTL